MVAPVKEHFIRKQEGAINSRVLLFCSYVRNKVPFNSMFFEIQ